MIPELVVVGSANLDLVVEVPHVPRPGETVLGGDLRRVPGGKGANQAVAAARLGRSVAMVGRVGDDEGGILLRTALEADGVDVSHLTTSDGPSGVAMIAVGADGENAIVVSPGANGRVAPEDLTGAEVMIGHARCLLLQLEIPLPVVRAATEMTSGTVILNPAPAPSGAVPSDLLEHVDVLVPNQSELATLAGYRGPVDVDVAVELGRALAATAVVVTLGAAGALVIAEDVLHVPAPTVTSVDTTAAGDAFCAALADGLIAGLTLGQATEWAVRVGAATTLRPGAQPSLPTRVEVAELLSEETT